MHGQTRKNTVFFRYLSFICLTVNFIFVLDYVVNLYYICMYGDRIAR